METDSEKLEVFTQYRPLLSALAQQMLGNSTDTQDILQEAFLRWRNAVADEIRSPKAYLTTIVTRLCLNHLSLARVQREKSVGATIPERLSFEQVFDPADYTRLADSLGTALQILLESLSPVERGVFLLREVFDCDYEEIALIVGKSDENCRQILRRARERIACRQVRFDISAIHHEHAVQEFIHASRTGDWQALMNAVAKDAVLVCDGSDTAQASLPAVRGALEVCEFLRSRADVLFPTGTTLEPVPINGPATLIGYQSNQPRTAFILNIRDGRLTGVIIITCPVRLRSFLIPQGLGGLG